MFLQLNLTLVKNKKIINILLLTMGILIVLLSILISDNSCGINHIGIIIDLQLYQKILDPEFCEDLIEKIDVYNIQCMPQVEILDCG